MDRCPRSCRQRIRQHFDTGRRVADQHRSRSDEYTSLTEHNYYQGRVQPRQNDAQMRLHCNSSDMRRPSDALSSHVKMIRSRDRFADYQQQSTTSSPCLRQPSVNGKTREEDEFVNSVQRAPLLASQVSGIESSCFGKSTVRTPKISGETFSASQTALHGLLSTEGTGLSGCGLSDIGLQRKKSKRSSRKFSCMSSADVLPTLTSFTPGNRHSLPAHNGQRFGELHHDRCFLPRGSLHSESWNHNADGSNMVSSAATVELSPLSASDAGNWSTISPDAKKFDSRVPNADDVSEVSDLVQGTVNDERQRNNPLPFFRSSGPASQVYMVEGVEGFVFGNGRDIERDIGAMDSEYRRTLLDLRPSPSLRSRAGCINTAVLSNSTSQPAPPSASRNARTPILYENMYNHSSSSSSSSSSPCTISPDFRHNLGFSPYSNTFDSPNLGMIYSPGDYFHGRAARASHYWPFRRFPLQSYEESREYFATPEILSTRERGERDALSYEQIFMLEANLLLGGMSSYDQHQDLRLDIDSMTYEELLALEDSMGYVCTGLEKHMIAGCLTIEKYCERSLATSNPVPDCIEVKCSICQEDFEEGLELATLQCGHKHHVPCVEQWLQRKNECPICKKPAFLSRTT